MTGTLVSLDSSSLVKLVVLEERTDELRAWLAPHRAFVSSVTPGPECGVEAVTHGTLCEPDKEGERPGTALRECRADRAVLLAAARGVVTVLTDSGQPVARVLPGQSERDRLSIRAALRELEEIRTRTSPGPESASDLVKEGQR